MSGPVKDYVCLDLETSGLYPKYDKIIEIGAVKVKTVRLPTASGLWLIRDGS